MQITLNVPDQFLRRLRDAIGALTLIAVPIFGTAACARVAPEPAAPPTAGQPANAQEEASEPVGAASLRTDRPRYSPYEVIRLSLRAPSDQTLRYSLCQPELERREAGVWRRVAPWTVRECPHNLSELPAGVEVSVPVRVPVEVQLGEYRFTARVFYPDSDTPSVFVTDPFVLEQSRWAAALRMVLHADRTVVSPGETVHLRAVTHNSSADTLGVGGECGPSMDVWMISPSGDTASVLHQMVRQTVGGDDAIVAFTCEGGPITTPSRTDRKSVV